MKYLLFVLIPLILYSCHQDKSTPLESNDFELIPLADGVYACIIKTHDHAIRNIENGLTPDDQNFFTIPSEYEEWWFGKFYKPNLNFMYENEKKKTAEI